MELFTKLPPIALMVQAKRFGAISLFLVVLSWVLIFTKEFNYGIDFAGGTLIQIQYTQKAPIAEIREILSKEVIYEGASVTYFGSDDEIIIRTKTDSKSLGVDMGDQIRTLLQKTQGFKEIRRVDMVGSKVGSELRESGIMALLLAIIGILVYVSIQFEWRFAVASVIALVHDVSIAVGAVSLLSVEFSLDTIAAILTILGYSINDTIIVFDRIREGIREGKESNLALIIDESVTKTLSRTTLTSLTVFFVVFTLYLFGGEIIKGFSFPLLVGVAVGTYSSIFIAAPITMWLKFSVSDFRLKEAEKLKREKEKEKMRTQFEQGSI